jgi:Protein of unknown function (DUF3007)
MFHFLLCHVLMMVFIMHQFVGVDSLQAGNAVQLIIVLGLTIGWISTYMFRVANKDMTYAKQLKDYGKKVMEVYSLLFILYILNNSTIF